MDNTNAGSGFSFSGGSPPRPIFTSTVRTDDATKLVGDWFDLSFDGEMSFTGWNRPDVKDFSIGLIVGASGTGKSLLLKDFGIEEDIPWEPTKAIVSQFDSPDDAIKRLMAVGFNNVRSFVKPFQVLSNGEQFRANLARRLKDGAVIDEFTSVVDRNVAKAAVRATRKYVTENGLKNIVFATCHSDVIPWLQPDWYFDTTDGTLHDGRLLQRPTIQVRIYPAKRSTWQLFAEHHYLSHKLGSAARCFIATAEFENSGEQTVGFAASIPMPSGTLKKAWRGHRTVVLPDFQGLGIGPRISDAVAQIHIDEGKRYYSRTAHPRLGAYRDRPNSGWKPTSKYKAGSGLGINSAAMVSVRKTGFNSKTHKPMNNINGFGGDKRACFSHEFVGANATA
jgi:GNAT superfamily N-acetyltransferase